jgi:hypothetical protein
MSSEQELLKRLYERFNARDIESVIAGASISAKADLFLQKITKATKV